MIELVTDVFILFFDDKDGSSERLIIKLSQWAETFILMVDDLIRTFNWLSSKHICRISCITFMIFPNKDKRSSFECVDQRKEKLVDEKLVMCRIEVR